MLVLLLIPITSNTSKDGPKWGKHEVASSVLRERNPVAHVESVYEVGKLLGAFRSHAERCGRGEGSFGKVYNVQRGGRDSMAVLRFSFF